MCERKTRNEKYKFRITYFFLLSGQKLVRFSLKREKSAEHVQTWKERKSEIVIKEKVTGS